MQAHRIRRLFLDFFVARGHREVASSSLVPVGDPTLLFTNAGMVQFKTVFQGVERRDYTRAATVQKCVRAGGKHNDLEHVGHTPRHHTFFEMLGNFSFGDYFKRQAIEFGWELVTSPDFYGIDPERIRVTVHGEDDEARRLWRDVTGISDRRIYGLGDADNYWQMGDTGPSGPCSEIYVELGGRRAPGPDLTAEEFQAASEAGRFLEIWNLVFMQYDLRADGSRVPLPAPSVDTGAGLERLAAVLQDADSNFHTDLFLPLIRRVEDVVDRPYDRGERGASHRVLADHARAVTFLLADAVHPSNEGRGYVLRRILRRAVRHAWLLGRREPTLSRVSETVIAELDDVYPELRQQADYIRTTIRAEEERFLVTIEDGLRRLDELTAGRGGTIRGDDAFRLYDTYGFPIDLTQLIAAERGYGVDLDGFERALAAQRRRSQSARAAADGVSRGEEPATGAAARAPAVRRSRSEAWVTVTPRRRQRWVGYDTTRSETAILRYRKAGEQLELVLHENPFYAPGGGQVADTGAVEGSGWRLEVSDVRKVDGRSAVVGSYGLDDFEPSTVVATVDGARRENVERNHTATHLVHAALRKVLGTHARQAGSVVAPDRLRFDFTHHGPLAEGELKSIEEEVNAHIWEDLPIETRQMSYTEAIQGGAMALFGEKYGDRVRVVDVPGVSLELCGGTHVERTGQIGLFRFTHETGVAAGVRRIEAVTGPGAYAAIRRAESWLREAADVLRAQPDQLAHRVEVLLEEQRRLERQVAELLRSGGAAAGQGAERRQAGDVTILVDDAPVDDRQQVALLMDAFRARNRRAVSVLFTGGERAGVHVGLTDDLVSEGHKAGDLVNAIASVSGGKGGGRPHFASAGVGDPGRLPEARQRAAAIVAELVAR